MNPGINRRSPTIQHDRPIRKSNSRRHIIEHDIVEHDRPIEYAVARGGTPEEHGRVGHCGVDDRFGRGSLGDTVCCARGDIEADLYRGDGQKCCETGEGGGGLGVRT